jgi:hypothetical protein
MKKTILLSTLFLGLLPLQSNAEIPNFRPSTKDGPTFGFGVGMSVPSSGLDTYIYRIRINPNMTIEPMLNLGSATSEVSTSTVTDVLDDDLVPTGETETTTTTTETSNSWVGGGLQVRYRLAKKGNTDFQTILGAGYLQTSSEESVAGVDGTSTDENSTIAVNIGAGLESYFAPKWSAGVDITTPVYTQITSTTTPTSGETEEGTGSVMAFSPSFRLMLTHYF